jgi:hypothetical protein
LEAAQIQYLRLIQFEPSEEYRYMGRNGNEKLSGRHAIFRNAKTHTHTRMYRKSIDIDYLSYPFIINPVLKETVVVAERGGKTNCLMKLDGTEFMSPNIQPVKGK